MVKSCIYCSSSSPPSRQLQAHKWLDLLSTFIMKKAHIYLVAGNFPFKQKSLRKRFHAIFLSSLIDTWRVNCSICYLHWIILISTSIFSCSFSNNQHERMIRKAPFLQQLPIFNNFNCSSNPFISCFSTFFSTNCLYKLL